MTGNISPKAFWGIGIAAVIVVAAIAIFFVRHSDPAAQGPIPYQKYDMGAHMAAERQKEAETRGASAAASTPGRNGR